MARPVFPLRAFFPDVHVGKRTQRELFQWGLVFTLMTLELGLVPLPLYARNR